MKKFLFLILSVLTFGTCSLLLVNASDETLNPAILPLLTWDTQPIDNNAYPLLLGFSAAANQAPLEFAQQRLQAYSAQATDPQDYRSTVRDNEHLLCNGADKPQCFENYLTQQDQINQLLTENTLWLHRYRRLIQYTHYRNTLKPTLSSPIPAFSAVLQSQKLLLAQIALNPIDMAPVLHQDITFWRNILRQKTHLITKMVAVNATASGYRLLHHLLRQQPEQLSLFHSILLPLNTAEKSLSASLNSEFQLMANGLLALKKQLSNAGPSNGFDALIQSPVGLYFYQKNATVNQLYQYHVRIQAAAEKDHAALEQAYHTLSIELKNVLNQWSILYNPVGKILISIATPNMSKSRQKIDALDALVQQTPTVQQ